MQCNAIKSNNILFFFIFFIMNQMKWCFSFENLLFYFDAKTAKSTLMSWTLASGITSHENILHCNSYYELMSFHLKLFLLKFSITNPYILSCFICWNWDLLSLKYIFQVILLLMPKVWVSIYNLQFLNVKTLISGIHFVGKKFESLNSGPKARLMSGSFEMRYFKAQNLGMDIHVLFIHCFYHFLLA